MRFHYHNVEEAEKEGANKKGRKLHAQRINTPEIDGTRRASLHLQNV